MLDPATSECRGLTISDELDLDADAEESVAAVPPNSASGNNHIHGHILVGSELAAGKAAVLEAVILAEQSAEPASAIENEEVAN